MRAAEAILASRGDAVRDAGRGLTSEAARDLPAGSSRGAPTSSSSEARRRSRSLFLGIGHATGLLDGDAPPWLFLVAVVGVDVAHVWSTGWRVLADGADAARRASRSTPASRSPRGPRASPRTPSRRSSSGGSSRTSPSSTSCGSSTAGSRSTAGRTARARTGLGRRLDAAAIYGATLTPLLFWHAHLPAALPVVPAGRLRRRACPPASARAAFVLYAGDLRRVGREGDRPRPRRPAASRGGRSSSSSRRPRRGSSASSSSTRTTRSR